MQVTVRAAALSLFIALFSLSAFAQDKDKKDPQAATPEAVAASKADDPELKNLAFPEVKGWTLSERTVYPIQGAGYSVSYDAPGNGRVTVYIYNAGRPSIPNELKGLVNDELEGAKGAIYQAAQAGAYMDLKEANTETITLGGEKGKVKALKASFTLGVRGTAMSSWLYVFPYRNNFIKLRITRPLAVDKELESSFAELMYAIDTLFAR